MMLKISKVTTRSMAKARDLESKPEALIGEEASPVKEVILEQDSLKEKNEKRLRLTQAWDQGLTDEDMKKWAWGTGSAEKYPPGEQHYAWRRHITDAKAATTGGMTSCECWQSHLEWMISSTSFSC